MISHILSMVKLFFSTPMLTDQSGLVAVQQICIFRCSSKLKHILMQHIAYIVLNYHKYLKHLSQLSFKWFDTILQLVHLKQKKIINWVFFYNERKHRTSVDCLMHTVTLLNGFYV